MPPKTFYITTAIDYTNAAPHIGHAYEKVLADVLARYHRLKGDDVFFLTGVDQHGQKVQQSAEKQGIPPQQFVDEVTKKFLALWEKLDVRYDAWAATTDPLHKKCVQNILQRLFNECKLYKAKQGGYYSIRQEQFLTDKERNENGEFGPEWGEVEFREEENYYFKLAEHKEWLLGFIDNHEDFVIPNFRRAELRNAVEKLSGDLCVSRPKSRLAWGIEFPFDPDYVTYVWFDALVNYISFAGYDANAECRMQNAELKNQAAEPQTSHSAFCIHHSSFSDLWPALHVIGKDILIPAHGVYWPIMLRALGFKDEEMPKLLVHGWWNIAGAKMSKSLGNSVDPNALADKYGAEALRYYLMSDIATGKDADFSEERLVLKYNTDLANSLGNLLNRTLSMAAKYRAGLLDRAFEKDVAFQIPLMADDPSHPNLRTNQTVQEAFGLNRVHLHIELRLASEAVRAQRSGFIQGFQLFDVSTALLHALALTHYGNSLVEIGAPWHLAKDASRRFDLDAILYTLAESLRIIAILISPVLPKAARGIFDQLDPEQKLSREFRLEDARWGVLEDGHIVGKPTPLFPRIEAAS